MKNSDFVECLPETTHVLRVPIQTDDYISLTNQYSLITTINHSGTYILNRMMKLLTLYIINQIY